jgi:hypothetical protein
MILLVAAGEGVETTVKMLQIEVIENSPFY